MLERLIGTNFKFELKGIRTPDLVIRSHMLPPLSY